MYKRKREKRCNLQRGWGLTSPVSPGTMFTDNTTYITTVLLSVSGIYQEKSEYYPHCHNKDLLLHKPAGRRLCFDLKHRRLVLYSTRAPWIQYPTAFPITYTSLQAQNNSYFHLCALVEIQRWFCELTWLTGRIFCARPPWPEYNQH